MHDDDAEHDASPVSRVSGAAGSPLHMVMRLRELARSQAQQVETRLLAELKQRLAAVDDDGGGEFGAAARFPTRAPSHDGGSANVASSAAALLHVLTERSLEQRPDTAEAELALRVVEQLVPDEARILAALSDGVSTAACHVSATNRVGFRPIHIIENASRIGAEAGVMLSRRVPLYLSHMLALGLLECGPEDRELEGRYAMLESESLVRDAVSRIENDLKLRPRITRFTLHISEFGRQLWAASASIDRA